MAVAAQPTADARFRGANAAYAEGRFAEAKAGYRDLIELGIDDADLYYNLGLAEARLGAHGPAIAAFENSLRLSGHRRDARQALENVRAQLGAERAERQGEATVSGGESFFELLFAFARRTTFAWLALLGVVVSSIVMFALRFWLPKQADAGRERTVLVLSIGLVLSLGLACFALLGVLTLRGSFLPGRDAVVLADVRLLEAPSEGAAEREAALTGERAFVTTEDGAFARVQMDGGREGWLAREHLEVLLAHR